MTALIVAWATGLSLGWILARRYYRKQWRRFVMRNGGRPVRLERVA